MGNQLGLDAHMGQTIGCRGGGGGLHDTGMQVYG